MWGTGNVRETPPPFPVDAPIGSVTVDVRDVPRLFGMGGAVDGREGRGCAGASGETGIEGEAEEARRNDVVSGVRGRVG